MPSNEEIRHPHLFETQKISTNAHQDYIEPAEMVTGMKANRQKLAYGFLADENPNMKNLTSLPVHSRIINCTHQHF